MSSLGHDQGAYFSKLVRINSSKAWTNGKSGYSLTNCIVDLGQNCQKVKRVSFVNVVFSNTAYNILDLSYSDPNNQGTFITDSGTHTFTVAKGYYDITSLMTAVAASMNNVLTTAGFGESVSFNQAAAAGTVNLTYLKGTRPNALMTLVANTTLVASIWPSMGFRIGQTLGPFLSSGLILPAPDVPQLTGLRQVYLRSSTLSPGNQFDEKGKLSDVCINIPVTATFGAVNVWECKVDKLCEIIYSSPRNFQQIDFALVDEDGSVIDLNGSNIRIELKIYFDKY